MVDTRSTGYTKTGNGWMASLGNKLSFFGIIPGVNMISAALIGGDSAISAIGWVFRGKLGSAAAEVAAGSAGAFSAAAMNNPVWWGVNAVSGVTTGRSVNTHARALTETGVSFLSKPLGAQPTVLRSHFGGVGGTGAAIAPQGPGRFTSAIAGERGQDANAAYQSYMRGEGGVHMNQLQSAYGRGA